MQKTLTVNGKRYTGKQISKMLHDGNKVNEADYRISLNGFVYFATYREVQCSYFAPVSSKTNATPTQLHLCPMMDVTSIRFGWVYNPRL